MNIEIVRLPNEVERIIIGRFERERDRLQQQIDALDQEFGRVLAHLHPEPGTMYSTKAKAWARPLEEKPDGDQ